MTVVMNEGVVHETEKNNRLIGPNDLIYLLIFFLHPVSFLGALLIKVDFINFSHMV